MSRTSGSSGYAPGGNARVVFDRGQASADASAPTAVEGPFDLDPEGEVAIFGRRAELPVKHVLVQLRDKLLTGGLFAGHMPDSLRKSIASPWMRLGNTSSLAHTYSLPLSV